METYTTWARSSRASRSGPLKNAVGWRRKFVQCRSGLVRGTWSAISPRARALRMVPSSFVTDFEGSSCEPKRVRSSRK